MPKVEDHLGLKVGYTPTFILSNDVLFCKDLYVLDCINETWDEFTDLEKIDIMNMLTTPVYRFTRNDNKFDMVFRDEEELNSLGITDPIRKFRMLKSNGFVTKPILDKYDEKINITKPAYTKYCSDFMNTIFGLMNTTVDILPFMFVYEDDDYGLEKLILDEMCKGYKLMVLTTNEMMSFIEEDKLPYSLVFNYVTASVKYNLDFDKITKLVNLKYINNTFNYNSLEKVNLKELIVTII